MYLHISRGVTLCIYTYPGVSLCIYLHISRGVWGDLRHWHTIYLHISRGVTAYTYTYLGVSHCIHLHISRGVTLHVLTHILGCHTACTYTYPGVSLCIYLHISRGVTLCTYTYPGVLEGLWSIDPLGGVHCEHAVDKVLGFWGHCVPFWRGVLKITNIYQISKDLHWILIEFHI